MRRDGNGAGPAWWRAPACALAFVGLSGCLAQQADLLETRIDLDNKIAKLDKKEREIQIQVDQANKLIEEQKRQVDELVKTTRAKLRSEISELRDETLPGLQGKIEEHSKRIGDLKKALDDRDARLEQLLVKRDAENEKRLAALGKAANEQTATVRTETDARFTSLEKAVEKAMNDQAASLAAAQKADREHLYENLVKLGARLDETNKSVLEVTKRLEARLQDHDRALGAGDAKTGGLAHQLDQQGRSLSDQMAQFGRALADFKLVLTGLGDKLAQQEQASQELSASLTRRAEDMAAKADALTARAEADAKATSSYLAEVNRSVGSVAKAVETMGGTFAARIDQQDRRLAEMTGALQAVASQVDVLGQTATRPRDVPDGGGTKRGAKPHKRVGEAEQEQKAAPEALAQAPSPGPAAVKPPAPASVEAAASHAAIEPPAPIAAVPAAAEGPASLSGQGADDVKPGAKDAYEAALAKFKQGDVEGAQRGFTEFLMQSPRSEFAPNAQYWLGECYYGKRDYRRAIEAFDVVRQVYPRSEKAPAALLKKGLAYLEMNERARATAALKEILSSYPKSPEAGKAGARLAQLEKKR